MKLYLHLSIGISDAYHEEKIDIPDEEVENLTEEEKNELFSQYANDWANNFIDLGFWTD